MKLTARLVSVGLLAVLLLLVADGWLFVREETATREADLERDAITLGNALAQVVADVWRDDGEDAVRALIADVHRAAPAIDLVLVGSTPRARAATGGLPPLRTRIPLEAPDERAAALDIEQPRDRIAALRRDAVVRRLVLAGGLLGVSVLGVVTVGLSLVGRPLEELVQRTRRIGAGDLSTPGTIRGRDELGELSDALDAMCVELARSQERARSETAARIAALEQLRHEDRLKTVGRLASGVAHELGTPLNVVAGRAAMIASGGLSGAQAVDCAGIIASQAAGMAAIVRGILDFARRRPPRKEPQDLWPRLEQQLALLAPLARQRGVELALSGERSARAAVDAGQLAQALTNVVTNAVQASPDGGVVEVELSCVRAAPPSGADGEGEYVRIAVRDRGTGIPADALPHVFEPFFTTKQVGEGTGLGLSIAHGIAREHGGWIDAANRPGGGSAFALHFPVGIEA